MIRTLIARMAALLLLFSVACSAAMAGQRSSEFQHVLGETAAGEGPGEFVVSSASAILRIGDATSTDYRVEFELKFPALAGAALVRVAPAVENDANAEAAAHLGLARNAEGTYLATSASRRNAESTWVAGPAFNLYYTPYAEPARTRMVADGLMPSKVFDHWVHVRVDVAASA